MGFKSELAYIYIYISLYVCNASGMQSAHAHCRSCAPRPAECMCIGPGAARSEARSPVRRVAAASERQWSRVRRERGDCLGPEWSDIVKPKRTSGDRDDARMTGVGRESFDVRRSLRVADLRQRAAERVVWTTECKDGRAVHALLYRYVYVR